MRCSKVAFANESSALFYIAKLKKTSHREIKPVNTYLCEKCLTWHLTSIESKEVKEVKYLKRQIENLKAKLLKLQNETQSQDPA
jgi:hypothetical protein